MSKTKNREKAVFIKAFPLNLHNFLSKQSMFTALLTALADFLYLPS